MRPRGFREALTRRPLKDQRGAVHPGASGSHKGLEPANVDWMIYVACSDGETIDVATYQALHTTISLKGLFDIVELKEVQGSWVAAAIANARESAGDA